MKVGFIGVGNIGSPMAEQISKAGFELYVHDIRKAAAESLLAFGIRRKLCSTCELARSFVLGVEFEGSPGQHLCSSRAEVVEGELRSKGQLLGLLAVKFAAGGVDLELYIGGFFGVGKVREVALAVDEGLAEL